MPKTRVSSFDKTILSISLAVGALAFVAYKAPDLVAFGSYLVIPYLLLAPAPTAFIYLALFTVCWFALRRVNRLLGLCTGLAAIYCLAYAFPEWINANIAAEDQSLSSTNRNVANPINVIGTVAIVKQPGRYDDQRDLQNDCDRVCRAILYSGGADSVIMAQAKTTRHKTAAPRIWRLKKLEQFCSLENGSQTPFRFRSNVDEDRMRARALNGECLVSAPATLAQAQTFVLYQRVGIEPSEQKNGLNLKLPSSGEIITISQRQLSGKNVTIAKRTILSPRKLNIPLRLTIGGSPNSGANWDWSRNSGQRERDDYLAIDTYLNLKLSSMRSVAPADLRTTVDRWLAQYWATPAAHDNEIAEQFYKLVDADGGQPGDIQRTVKILLDPRTRSPGLSWMVKQKFPDSEPLLFDAIVTRMESVQAENPILDSFDGALDLLRPSVFSRLDSRMVAMLRDPIRRRSMRNSLSMLGYAGRDAAPFLFSVLREAVDSGPEKDLHVVVAALSGLCRMGPQIAPAYAEVEKIVSKNSLIAANLEKGGYGSQTYPVTLFRLGRPISTLTKPGSAGDGWRENLQRSAANAECDMQ